MQKTIIAAAVAAAFGMGGAHAADLNGGSLKDAPVYMPGIMWTGFYLGAGGGGGALNQDIKGDLSYAQRQIQDTATLNGGKGSTSIASADLNGLGGTGGFGTVQVGYDKQLDQHFVVGAFFDYDFDDIGSKVSAKLFSKSYSASVTLTNSWTAGGRAGYLVNPNTLVYGLAGYTEAHFDMPKGAQKSDFSGWTAGAGIETNLGGSWFLKGEYRFTQLDRETVYSSKIGYYGNLKITDQPDIQTGRLVLTYKLSAFGPESLK